MVPMRHRLLSVVLAWLLAAHLGFLSPPRHSRSVSRVVRRAVADVKVLETPESGKVKDLVVGNLVLQTEVAIFGPFWAVVKLLLGILCDIF